MADDTPDPQLRRGRRRVTLLSAALTLVAGPALWWLARQPGDLDVGILVVVTLMFLASEIFIVDVEFRHESQILTFTTVPLVVGLMVLPPAVVLAARLVTMVVLYAGVQRQPSFKLALNTVTAALDVVIVTAIISLGPDGDFGPSHWLVVFAAVVAGDTFSGLTTTAAISCFQGRWERGAFRDLLLGTVGAAVDVAVAVVAVTLIDDGEPAALVLLAVGAFVVAILRAYARIRTRYRALELLDRFTRAVGESVTDGSAVGRLLSESADILHADRSWLIALGSDDDLRLELVDGVVQSRPADPLDHEIVARLVGQAELLTSDGPLAEEMSGASIDELIAAPLGTTHGTTYALVIADRSGEVREFDRDDVALFETLSVHAGLALQNLGLVDRLRTEIEVTEHTATHDALTSLPNRNLFQQRLDAEIARGGAVAVLLLDLDRFKEVNDTLGHRNGDLLLVEVGRRLASAFPGDDEVARLGGDEFAVMLRDCESSDEAVAAARRIVSVLQRPVHLEDVAIDIGASVGVSLVSTRTPGSTDGVTLLRQADVAMYLAKDDRTDVEVYSADRDNYSPHRLALAGRLRAAIDERTLALHYQPQLDLATGDVIGVEALVRWPQPGKMPIPPDEFIYIAEHTGLIHSLTEFVLEEAISQAARWHRDGLPLRVSVNLSAYDLVDHGIVERVRRRLVAGNVPPESLMIELTESAVMINPTKSVEIMTALRGIGVAIAIDDFGTGHSSLAYLTGVPATELKIDKSFVFAMGSDPAADTIVRSIIDLGRNLGLELVAEGAETEAHATALARMGCDIVQGYFYSRPLEVRGLELWLEGRTIAGHAGRTRVEQVQD